MHDVLDTEDFDSDAERYWPEEFKKTLRARLVPTIAQHFRSAQSFKSIYEALYTPRFSTYDTFVDRLAEMVAIGAENGIDQALIEAHATFGNGAPLPPPRPFATFHWPQPFDQAALDQLHQDVHHEYLESHAYEHAHEDHFQDRLPFETFIDTLTGLVVSGAANGADTMLAKLYRAFLQTAPLPPARRYPRRLQ